MVMIGDMINRDIAVAKNCQIRSIFMVETQQDKEKNIKDLANKTKLDMVAISFNHLRSVVQQIQDDATFIQENESTWNGDFENLPSKKTIQVGLALKYGYTHFDMVKTGIVRNSKNVSWKPLDFDIDFSIQGPFSFIVAKILDLFSLPG